MASRICDVKGCEKPHETKGLCAAHHYQTPEGKAAAAAAYARRCASPEAMAAKAAYQVLYMATKAGKATRAAGHSRYAVTDKGKAWAERGWARVSLKRAVKAGAVIGDVPPDTRAILRGRFGETCLVDGCNNVATDVDHVIALANGGAHDISNFQTLCGSCNKSKGAKTIDYRPHV